MSLRAFHLFFIALSVILTAFFAAWAGSQYQSAHDAEYALVAVASLAWEFARRTRSGGYW